MAKYQPQEFEKKWREIWKKEGMNKFRIQNSEFKTDKKFYTLVELPYTSGDLHIGHWFAFTPPDVLSRYKSMNGYDVFFPIGYDAFGLPAENAAIKRKIHPKDWTMKNIENMTKQFQTMGTMLNNWDDVVVTCLPEYYRWNQWIFLKMYEKGLAYRGKALSNWCEFDQTVLANENVEEGKCWRCGNQVVQKEVEQWFLRITKYADRLEWPNEPKVDWPKQVRVGQNNWIGRKTGINMDYPVKDNNEIITCFTTAPVNFGMTFIALSPNHPIVKKILNGKVKVPAGKKEEVERYAKTALAKTEQQRLVDATDRSGVFTGLYATNRIAGWDVPIWVSDFVIGEVGTGAVQGCPGHDYRDFEFAKKFDLPIIRVVVGPDGDKSKIERPEQIIIKGMKGKMVNSKFLDGLEFSEGLQKTMDYAEKKDWGKRVNSYHLRDWSISRQRYWGTPVPIIHCKDCGIVVIAEKDLPVELPYEVDFTPKGKPPLATNEKWLNVKCPKCGKDAKRDAETLDTFFDSAWYWFRYISPHYNDGPFNTYEVKGLTPVDVYFGGAEHTLGHTLYARFFTKFFKDIGLVDYEEFASKRIQHGIVLGPDGNRMSKSKGNVINPDDIVAEYGTDTVRLYLCFMMPYDATGPWSDTTIAGVHRFLTRVWKMFQRYQTYAVGSEKSITSEVLHKKSSTFTSEVEDKQLVAKLQKTIKKVTNDIEKLKLNTAIAAMMEFLNDWEATSTTASVVRGLSREHVKKFLQILAPFAPFMTEEIWREVFGEKNSIHLSQWPKVEGEIVDEETVIPVQVNGKLRATIKVKTQKSKVKEYVEKEALKQEKVTRYLEKQKYKAIYIEGKILNFVTN